MFDKKHNLIQRGRLSILKGAAPVPTPVELDSNDAGKIKTNAEPVLTVGIRILRADGTIEEVDNG